MSEQNPLSAMSFASSPLLLRTKFANALTKVERVIEALKEEGIECRPNSSLGSLFSKVRQLNKQHERDPTGNESDRFFASIEALWIAEALEMAIGEPGSREPIRRIVGSDMSLAGRQLSRGKDALWELDLYRRLKLGGAEVRLDEPDLVIALGNGLGNYGVACKKVYSDSEVVDAFEYGCRQLIRQGLPGVVAFNLDDLMEEKALLRAPTSEALHRELVRRGQKFLTRHAVAFQKMIDRDQCDGVLISISIVSEVPDDPLPITLVRVPVLYPGLAVIPCPGKSPVRSIPTMDRPSGTSESRQSRLWATDIAGQPNVFDRELGSRHAAKTAVGPARTSKIRVAHIMEAIASTCRDWRGCGHSPQWPESMVRPSSCWGGGGQEIENRWLVSTRTRGQVGAIPLPAPAAQGIAAARPAWP